MTLPLAMMTVIAPRLAAYREAIHVARYRMAAKSRTRLRLAYIGAHGGRNLGDDAMLVAARGLLAERELIPFAPYGRERRLARLGLSGPDYFDSVILGGGTLINPYWAGHVRDALSLGVPVWSLGTGVGSCGFDQPDDVAIEEWAPLLRSFHRIGVRGPLSRAALASLGVPGAEITGDLALCLARHRPAPPADPPRIALNLARASDTGHGEMQERAVLELEAVLRPLLARGWQLAPVALHPSDVGPLTRLLRRLSPGDLTVPIAQDGEEFFRRAGPCTLMIGVRLHAAVLSCCAGVPPLMLGYRDKCRDFMLSMDLEAWHVSLASHAPGEITEKARHLLDQAPGMRGEILDRAQAWKQKLKKYVASL